MRDKKNRADKRQTNRTEHDGDRIDTYRRSAGPKWIPVKKYPVKELAK